jgi:hypothetical protein
MSMKNKLSIILISLFINISLKKPMWFFFNQLGMPFELYLIWVGINSCIIAFIVLNLKKSKDKLTLLNYLYIFTISIIFIYIIHRLGVIYLAFATDIFKGLVFSILISGSDLFFNWSITKFDLKDFFKSKLYLGIDEEELSNFSSIIKLIKPDNNYKKGGTLTNYLRILILLFLVLVLVLSLEEILIQIVIEIIYLN